MRCLKRNKRVLYVCNWYKDDKIKKYNNPIEISINYQPTNSDGDLIALGLNFPMYMRIKADLKYYNNFKAGDRVYISKKPTNDFDGLCKDADYEVDSEPLKFINSIEITLKKLSGK